MQPYVPQSTALPAPTAANRPAVDPNLQTLVGLMSQQQAVHGQEGQGMDGEPIRPEATRALAQLGATSQPGTQQLLQMSGDPLSPDPPVAHVDVSALGADGLPRDGRDSVMS